MFCIKICCLEPEPVGAELLQVEPEPKKISGAGAEEKWFGSATMQSQPSFLVPQTSHLSTLSSRFPSLIPWPPSLNPPPSPLIQPSVCCIQKINPADITLSWLQEYTLSLSRLHIVAHPPTTWQAAECSLGWVNIHSLQAPYCCSSTNYCTWQAAECTLVFFLTSRHKNFKLFRGRREQI